MENPYLCLRIERDNSGWDPIRALPLGPADKEPALTRPHPDHQVAKTSKTFLPSGRHPS